MTHPRSPVSLLPRRAAFILASLALFLCTLRTARADAAADWQQIEAMDKTGPGVDWKSRDEAQAATLAFLAKQEAALRAYLHDYPGDAHEPDAKLRLAHLLATRGDLTQDPHQRAAAESLLDDLEAEPVMKDRRADVEFARISIFMQRVDATAGGDRDKLLAKARAFAREFPSDHRVAPLLAEVADAYGDEPRLATALLQQARPVAQTPEIKARIDDDLKRFGLLGKPLDMHWTSIQGNDVDLRAFRGKVVLIYFFAGFSTPSMIELDWVNKLAGGDNADSVQALGICLDNDPVPVPDMLSNHNIAWPVYCDGHGWQSPLVRGLGINALPTLWLLDRNGILRSIDADQTAPSLIAHYLGESQR